MINSRVNKFWQCANILPDVTNHQSKQRVLIENIAHSCIGRHKENKKIVTNNNYSAATLTGVT